MPRKIKTAEEKEAKAKRVAAKMVSRCPPEITTIEGVRKVDEAIYEGYFHYQRRKRGDVSCGMNYVRRYLANCSTHLLKQAVEQGKLVFLILCSGE
jgi:hypothetical protein